MMWFFFFFEWHFYYCLLQSFIQLLRPKLQKGSLSSRVLCDCCDDSDSAPVLNAQEDKYHDTNDLRPTSTKTQRLKRSQSSCCSLRDEKSVSKRVDALLSLGFWNCFWLIELEMSNVQLQEIREIYFCTKKIYEVNWFWKQASFSDWS